MKTFGSIYYKEKIDSWIIEECSPHISIKLKAIFPKLAKNKSYPFIFDNSAEVCIDLAWFMSRYPLKMSNDDAKLMEFGRQIHIKTNNEINDIFAPDYVPKEVLLKDGKKARNYQLVAKDMLEKCERLLLGDQMGLGKTVTSMLCCMIKKNDVNVCLPAAVVVQAHLCKQWKDAIEEFTNLSVYIIKKSSPYKLPQSDVYIFSYHKICGWVDVFKKKSLNLKLVTFDEVAELRRKESTKYSSAIILSKSVDYCLGMSGTPIMGYGNEIFNILNCIKPMCLGNEDDFMREWTKNNKLINDPKALGSYLLDNNLMLRRTREDVNKELPPVNKIVHHIDYDHEMAAKADMIARQLAIKATSGSFIERGSASRDLDIFARYQTGMAKAKYAAEFIKILLENGEPVLVAAWHIDVHSILMEELAEYNPVFYTGSESPKQKEESKEAFINGKTNLMIMSLRSGIGTDGLQKRCRTVVFAELDYSSAFHDQFIGRVHRDGSDHENDNVTAFFLVSNSGSDPIIMNICGLKASQSQAIIDPNKDPMETYSDESRAKMLANYYLSKSVAVN